MSPMCCFSFASVCTGQSGEEKATVVYSSSIVINRFIGNKSAIWVKKHINFKRKTQEQQI